MSFGKKNNSEETMQEFIQNAIKDFGRKNIIVFINKFPPEKLLSPHVLKQFAEYINMNNINKKTMKKINNLFGFIVGYSQPAYIFCLHFIKSLTESKLHDFYEISDGNIKNIINDYFVSEDILRIKNDINNLIVEWDPLFINKHSHRIWLYRSYIDPIFSLKDNETELKNYLLKRLNENSNDRDFIKNQKNNLDNFLSKIIKLK